MLYQRSIHRKIADASIHLVLLFLIDIGGSLGRLFFLCNGEGKNNNQRRLHRRLW